MKQDHIDLEEQIERCERLADALTDADMRDALFALAEDYRAELKRRNGKPFMLSGDGAADASAGGSAAGAR